MDYLTSVFTDDTKLYSTLTNDINSSNGLQEDMTKLLRWPMKMRIHFHSGKCHVLHLGHSKTQKSYNLNDDSSIVGAYQGMLGMLGAERSAGGGGIPPVH